MITAGKRILVFGDSLSHVGPDAGPAQVDISATGRYSSPGALLAQRLLAGGASAARVNARIGRSAHNFWGRESTRDMIHSDHAWKPDVVLVMLGTNDLGLSMSVDGDDMARIRDFYSGTGVEVWGIGPPSFASADLQGKTDAVVEMMRKVFGDRFIDARPLTSDLTNSAMRTSDGVHFKQAGAEVFAGRLADATPRAGSSSTALLLGVALVLGYVVFRK